jgi:hypothetical protein
MHTTKLSTITGLSGHPMSGLWLLSFANGDVTPIESGHGVRQLAACFGATEGKGDLMEKIVGKEVYYTVDGFGILEAFTPVLEADSRMVWAVEQAGGVLREDDDGKAYDEFGNEVTINVNGD